MNSWRWILSPFGLLYWLITSTRNVLFDAGILKRHVIEGPSICIGNLNVGGSGKSPLTLYLMKAFQATHHIQVVSRGYGRTSRGHIQLTSEHEAREVGDEPLMYFKHKNPSDEIHVSESRIAAIQKLNRDSKHLLLLDDAFQHRYVQAGMNILVSDFNSPFFKDYILPIGTLREPRIGAKRANLVVFTKCPLDLSQYDKQTYEAEATRLGLRAFFSRIQYAPLQSIQGNSNTDASHVLLVTGIANPIPLEEHLEKTYTVHPIRFSDHHEFTQEEIKQIHKKFDTFEATKTIIVTTEKDFMRLNSKELFTELSAYPWFIQPIALSIENEPEFLTLIRTYVSTN